MILLAHGIFFAVLLLNTVFSVRFWRPLQPANYTQGAIDGALIMAYILLAIRIGSAVEFMFFALLLFLLATMKYVLMLGQVPHLRTVRKKILIDLLGALLCATALLLTLMGEVEIGAWLLTGVFVLANIFLLWVRPMYKIIG